ncbi:COQ9 family protein [Rickettsiales endosymbiont of Stachyamoeba lipophora]|uniref:COQ9 family protein n=1 Tax=Rickettsiales endosymbiont of Stachyamoeba lipophora TaxID=2486578 RepID=UPI000F64F4DD|nr:COQ9 family protein [Rickettsiales endosymbiont of Stachyamoeba lipophora]AZL15567.1 COQ9 family protein [Rickettsiales endosymbiont of Stachyamoeba lipophora]
MESSIIQDKKLVINSFVANIHFEGWTKKNVYMSFQNNNLDPNLAQVYFPKGFIDIFQAIITQIDELMKAQIDHKYLASLKVREKIFYLTKTRILAAKQFKDALRTGASMFVCPNKLGFGFEILWQSADQIWRIAGDRALDFNYYSKRGLLSYVYFTTLTYWFEDNSEDTHLTWRFLENKIEQILKIGKVKSNISGIFDQFKLSRIPVIRYIWAKAKSGSVG